MYTEDKCHPDTASDLKEPQSPIQTPFIMLKYTEAAMK